MEKFLRYKMLLYERNVLLTSPEIQNKFYLAKHCNVVLMLIIRVQ